MKQIYISELKNVGHYFCGEKIDPGASSTQGLTTPRVHEKLKRFRCIELQKLLANNSKSRREDPFIQPPTINPDFSRGSLGFPQEIVLSERSRMN